MEVKARMVQAMPADGSTYEEKSITGGRSDSADPRDCRLRIGKSAVG